MRKIDEVVNFSIEIGHAWKSYDVWRENLMSTINGDTCVYIYIISRRVIAVISFPFLAQCDQYIHRGTRVLLI